MSISKAIAIYFLCENAYHDFETVSVISPVVLNNKTEFALKLFDAYMAQEANMNTKVMPVIKAEVLGYVDQDGIAALEQYHALAKYIHEVFRFKVCKRCKTSSEIEINTEESRMYISTLVALLRARMYDFKSVIAAKLVSNGEKAVSEYGRNFTAETTAMNGLPAAVDISALRKNLDKSIEQLGNKKSDNKDNKV